MRTRLALAYVALALPALPLLPGCQDAGARREATGTSVPSPKIEGPSRDKPHAPGALRELGSDDEGEVHHSTAGALKQSAARWKDPGVYVDGELRGILAFGELPITLAPIWIEQRTSAPVRPGQKGPGYRIVKQRHYSFLDYLKAIGVPVDRINEVHVLGPRTTQSIIVSGQELRRRGKEFLFRFGSEVGGKPIPVVPSGFGNEKSPDKANGMLVYIDRKPPTIDRELGFVLDGKQVHGVPYGGEPIRGGVRVYQDDRLVAVIKRRLLGDATAQKGLDGKPHWKLFAFLKAQGIDTSKIAEAWVVRAERRAEKLSHAEIAEMTFWSNDGARGEIFLGPKEIPTNVLALHSKPVPPEKLPKILPDEE